jgi:hypothetical protein
MVAKIPQIYSALKIYENISVAFYECATWSATQREEHRLSVSENMVLSRLFGPKREKVAGR